VPLGRSTPSRPTPLSLVASLLTSTHTQTSWRCAAAAPPVAAPTITRRFRCRRTPSRLHRPLLYRTPTGAPLFAHACAHAPVTPLAPPRRPFKAASCPLRRRHERALVHLDLLFNSPFFDLICVLPLVRLQPYCGATSASTSADVGRRYCPVRLCPRPPPRLLLLDAGWTHPLQPRRPCTGGAAVTTSSPTPAGRCRGRNPGVGPFLYSSALL
jgi:hypothetical protein